jgi:gliding motility-associated-like protein
LLSIPLAYTSYAQIPVDFQFCTGTGELCVTPSDSTYELCLKLKPGFCESKEYEIRWGDGNTQKVTLTGEKSVSHVYDLRSFAKNCSSGEIEYNFNIRNLACGNDNKGYLLIFKKRPEAKPTIEAACAGSSVYITNNSCPVQDIDFLWEFSDGQTSTDSYPTLSFSDPTKTYKVKLTATSKVCGTSTAEAEFKLGKLPVANFKATGTTVIEKDTVVCVSSGGVLELDGSISQEETGYSWDIDGGKFTYQNNTDYTSGTIKIKLDEVKEYTVTLSVSNNCGTKRITRKYKVIGITAASLTPQPDACEETVYKITNPIPGAVYTLNNAAITPGLEVPVKFASTPYIVKATISNACGTQVASDTFMVSPAQPVKILSIPKDTILCVSANTIVLTANLPGGEWSQAGVETQNGQKVFVPQTAGTYTLTYSRGTGKCLMSSSVKINVEGIEAIADNKTICEGTAWVKLTGAPAAGKWTMPSCPSCIKGDTLFTAGLSGDNVEVTYSVASGAGCKAEAIAKIAIGSPKAAFSLNGGCSGGAFTPVNSSVGAQSYTWLVNGKNVASEENPNLSLAAGIQKIMLIAKAGSCSDTITKEITITTPPVAISFTPDQTAGCSPLRVAFKVNGTPEPGIEYTWQIDGNAVFTGFQLPQQVLQNQEKNDITYQVSVTAKNACGDQTDKKEITVRPLARAEIGVDSTVVRCTPASLLFSNRSSGHDKNQSRWLFGDGTILQSGADTISHLFSAKDSLRTYTVRLEVTSACGRDTAEVAIKVYPSTVKALYTISKSEVCPGEVVTFTDASVPKPNRWLWRFGDGSLSTVANPAHTFSKDNSEYKVTLIAHTGCGSDSTQQIIKTTQKPTGTFDALALTCDNVAVKINNKSDPELGFVWDFGDGSPLDSVNHSPEHQYQVAGTYQVSLHVFRGTQACKILAKKAPVTVVAPAKADFGFGGDSLFCAPGPVSIVNLSEPADQYLWYFSDGRTANVSNPTLAFEPGQYDVKLVTVKGGVCMDSTERAAAFVVRHCEVNIPDAFTPNGDGMGDRYTLFGTGISKVSQLRIRNRWGELIFEMKDVNPGSQLPGESWDGTFGGKEAPADMYVYEAEVLYVDQKKSEKLRGNFYLTR